MYVHVYIIIQSVELCLEFEFPLEYNVKHDNKNNTNNNKTTTNNNTVANRGIFVLERTRLPYSNIFHILQPF